MYHGAIALGPEASDLKGTGQIALGPEASDLLCIMERCTGTCVQRLKGCTPLTMRLKLQIKMRWDLDIQRLFKVPREGRRRGAEHTAQGVAVASSEPKLGQGGR